MMHCSYPVWFHRAQTFRFLKFLTLSTAALFLTAIGLIQHTKEGDISREKTILMTSLRLERAAAVR